jgi:hypothetical protein
MPLFHLDYAGRSSALPHSRRRKPAIEKSALATRRENIPRIRLPTET